MGRGASTDREKERGGQKACTHGRRGGNGGMGMASWRETGAEEEAGRSLGAATEAATLEWTAGAREALLGSASYSYGLGRD